MTVKKNTAQMDAAIALLAQAETAGKNVVTSKVAFTEAEPAKAPTPAAQVAAALPSSPKIDLDALLEYAREKLSLSSPAAVVDNEVEAIDANTVNALLAQASEYDRVAKAATKERAKITELLAEYTGVGHELTVNKAVVFTVTEVVTRSLNTDHIKSLFPDIPENAEMWKESVATRRLYK